MKKEQILLRVWRSRKSYLFYYFIIFLVIGILGYFYYLQVEISSTVLIIAIVVVILLVKIIEIHRIRNWWAITESSFVESKGILNKNVRELDFTSISDIDLNQGFFKRLLGYGTINVRRFLNETSIVINNINRPERFLNILQDAIRLRKEAPSK